MSKTITLINNLSANDPNTLGAGFTPSDAQLSKAIVKMWTSEYQTPGQRYPTSVYYRHDYHKHDEARDPGTDHYPPVDISSLDPQAWASGDNWKTWSVSAESTRWTTKGEFDGLSENTWYFSLEISCVDYETFPPFVLDVPDFETYLCVNLVYAPDALRSCVYYSYVIDVDGNSTTYQLGTQPAFIHQH